MWEKQAMLGIFENGEEKYLCWDKYNQRLIKLKIVNISKERNKILKKKL